MEAILYCERFDQLSNVGSADRCQPCVRIATIHHAQNSIAFDSVFSVGPPEAFWYVPSSLKFFAYWYDILS